MVSISEQAWPTGEAPRWRRQRPAWLLVGLSLVTFGLYPFYWLYATWRELKYEQSDVGKRPVWHTLAILFVPVYSYFRFHAHMREIREYADTNNVAISLSPGWALIVWIITSIVSNASFRLFLRGFETPFWLDVVISAADGAVIAWAQVGLNAVWEALPGGATAFRIHPLEVILLVIGGLITGLILIVSS